MKAILNKIIANLGYIIIIGGLLVGEKIKTHVTWEIIIKENFWRMIFWVIIAIIVDMIVKYYKDNK
jgi:hypothetical protein